MSYNCFIKSRSAFLLLFDGEMTSGFLCRSTSLLSVRRRRRGRNSCITTLRWKWPRSHKHQPWIKSGDLSLCHMHYKPYKRIEAHFYYRLMYFMLKPIHGQCEQKYNVLFVTRLHTWVWLICAFVHHTTRRMYWIKFELWRKKKQTHFAQLVRTPTHTHRHTHKRERTKKEIRQRILPKLWRAAVTEGKEQDKYHKFLNPWEWYAASPAHSASIFSSFVDVNSPLCVLLFGSYTRLLLKSVELSRYL